MIIRLVSSLETKYYPLSVLSGASQFQLRYEDPGQFEVIVVIMNGCLKLSNGGKWRLGFTKMTNYAGASQCYR